MLIYNSSPFSVDRSLWVMKLEVNSTEKNKANIKLIGNIHGNEAVGREVLLHFIHVSQFVVFHCEKVFIIPFSVYRRRV